MGMGDTWHNSPILAGALHYDVGDGGTSLGVYSPMSILVPKGSRH